MVLRYGIQNRRKAWRSGLVADPIVGFFMEPVVGRVSRLWHRNFQVKVSFRVPLPGQERMPDGSSPG
jgi:hypothetical protein